MPKRKQLVEESSSEGEQFHVECVLAVRQEDPGSELEYLVKWADYDSDANSWEPEENVAGCTRLLKKFWKHVGKQPEEPFELHASSGWIEEEINYFAETFGSDKKPKKKRAKESNNAAGTSSRMPESTSNKRKSSNLLAKINAIADSESSSDSDATPLIERMSRPKKRNKAEADPTRASGSATDKPPRKMLKEAQRKDSSMSGNTSKARKVPRAAVSKQSYDDASDSLNSLFSEESSPDMALKDLPPTKPSNNASATQARHAVAPKQQGRRATKFLPMDVKDPSGNPTKVMITQSQKSLTGLSFKKNSGPNVNAGSSAAAPGPSSKPLTINTSARSSFSNAMQSPASAQSRHGGAFVDSSVTAADNEFPPPHDPRRPQILTFPRRSTGYRESAPGLNTQADDFLSTVMPTELSAPMLEISGVDTAPISRPRLPPKPLPKIPKKWKWSGDLFIDVSLDRAERLCSVSLSEPSEARPSGLRLSICLEPGNSLRLAKLYSVHDLYLLLGACDTVQQFAKLGPQADEDSEALRTLMIHMDRRRLCSYAHIFLDNISVALLVVFPSTSTSICDLFKVPRKENEPASLVAALVPWTLAADEFENMRLTKPRSAAPSGELLDPALPHKLQDAGHTLIRSPLLYRALRILDFPQKLYEIVFKQEQPYCIWHTAGDGSPGHPGFETRALKVILDTCRLKNVGHKADVKFVFVHVGALVTLHKFMALAMRRSKQPDLRFITYGTHDSIHPDRWGVRQIYPIGGIVTFTPSAILENPIGIVELIKKIDQRPLWMCYILPSVIAMLAKLTCQGSPPLVAFDNNEFIFDELLKLVETGRLSVLRAPTVAYPVPEEAAREWISRQLRFMRFNARELLEECIQRSVDQYSGVTDAELPTAIEKEIARDLWDMQLQPDIMDQFRRFVAIHGRNDRLLVGEEVSGVECVLFKQFSFKDEYYDEEKH